MKRADLVVMVFTRAPIPGHVKTRLIPALGEQGAADLHRRLAEQTVASAVNAKLGPVHLWCTPSVHHGFFAALVPRYGVELHTQIGEDLGERMARAFETALQTCAGAILVGSDCPSLSAGHLTEAAESLAADHQAVFGPAADGGYVLVGLKRAERGVFADIPWGSADVMGATRERLRSLGWKWHELPVLRDVDRPEDLEFLPDAGLSDT